MDALGHSSVFNKKYMAKVARSTEFLRVFLGIFISHDWESCYSKSSSRRSSTRCGREHVTSCRLRRAVQCKPPPPARSDRERVQWCLGREAIASRSSGASVGPAVLSSLRSSQSVPVRRKHAHHQPPNSHLMITQILTRGS